MGSKEKQAKVLSSSECYPALYNPKSEILLSLGKNGRAILVGCSADADFVLPSCGHDTRKYLEIRFAGRRWVVTAVAAGPTIIVNNQEVGNDGIALSHGDVIAFGQIAVLFLGYIPAFLRPEASGISGLYLPYSDSYVSLSASRSFVLGQRADVDIPFPNDPTCSGRQVRIEVSKPSRVDSGLSKPSITAVPVSESVKTFLNAVPMASAKPLRHGDILSFGASFAVYLERRPVRAQRSAEIEAEQSDGTMLMTAVAEIGEPVVVPNDFAISGRMRIGRGQQCEIFLDHPAVSRLHAEVTIKENRVIIRDFNSRNGTFVNDTRIDAINLDRGDRIDIGPYSLVFSGHSLSLLSRAANARVVARSVSHTVVTANGQRELLHDISLVIERGDFVCILGPSGCGKTTLMNALSGRLNASGGEVWVNGTNLYQHFDLLKSDIAHVPQHDVLHEDISLTQALFYTARLRFSPDATRDQRCSDVDLAISSVDLNEISANQIKSYSGGQKKRASLANETLCRPALLFLDEVTSGLDEKTDEEMMRLCRRMADNGKIIICITHTLANVEAYCNKIIVLQKGGRLAFFGNPVEAKSFFSIDRLGGIYHKLEQMSGEEAESCYRSSEYYHRYVVNSLIKDCGTAENAMRPLQQKACRNGPNQLMGIWRQLLILTERCAILTIADWKSVAIALGQALLIGILLRIVFDSGAAGLEINLVFLMSTCALWFGCNNAAKEIVKERPIYRRERDINLGILPYVTSKLLVYGALAVTQILILSCVVSMLIGIPGNNALQVGMLALTALVGTVMGLCISASVMTRDQATTLVPLALIPQIVLAGVIVPNMPLFADQIARVVVSGYWAFKGMSGILLPGAPDNATYLLSVGVLLLHTLVFFVLACLVMVRHDKKG